jgi:signal transduction histidine kinase
VDPACPRQDGADRPFWRAPRRHPEALGFVLDLTAQKSVDAQNAMLRESQEALRLRDVFNSVASHELKTPLTALLLKLKTLGRRLGKEAPECSSLRAQLDR